MSIGENIKKYRKEKGLTQSELGTLTELATNTIQRYEKGHRQPTIEILNKIATALEIPIAKLIGGISFKKANSNYYKDIGDDGIVDLLKNEGFNENTFRTSSIEDKENFINNSLSNINPLELALKKYLDNFDNLKKSDLVDFANISINYINCVKNDFCSELYDPLYNKYQALLDYVEFQNEQIKKYQKVCDDMLNTLKNTNSNDNK